MLKIRPSKVIDAVCDSCKTSLIYCVTRSYLNANFALIENNFGYGSRLDDIMISIREGYPKIAFHLCENCYEKALAAVGLKDPRSA